jgi:hypothetical protein
MIYNLAGSALVVYALLMSPLGGPAGGFIGRAPWQPVIWYHRTRTWYYRTRTARLNRRYAALNQGESR